MSAWEAISTKRMVREFADGPLEPERLTLYFLLPGQRMTTTRTVADADVLKRRIAVVADFSQPCGTRSTAL